MATSKLSASDSDYYIYMADNDDGSKKGHCWPKICWLLMHFYHYTIGSCCYAPLKWLCVTLFHNFCCKNDTKHNKEETSEYETLSKITFPKNTQDTKWKRSSQIDEADRRMKERLQYHFQDHIQKWTNMKGRRFPWKLVLHLLLVVSVTVQVSNITQQVEIIGVRQICNYKYNIDCICTSMCMFWLIYCNTFIYSRHYCNF